MLTMAIVLIVVGLAVAVGLEVNGGHATAVTRATRPLSSDQRLIDQLMVTQSDLPNGWQVQNMSSNTMTPNDQRVQQQISQAFLQCMGISPRQGNFALGGPSSDQLAQTSSPVFVGPGAGSGSGAAIELQTAASIVSAHGVEQRDFTLFTNPKFPQCNATAVAAETQLGVNDASGGSSQPGSATGVVVSLPTFAGEQLFGLHMTFDVVAHATAIPVEVNEVAVGSGRIEAELQTVAIGTQFPSSVLSSVIGAFEQRIASRGGQISA